MIKKHQFRSLFDRKNDQKMIKKVIKCIQKRSNLIKYDRKNDQNLIKKSQLMHSKTINFSFDHQKMSFWGVEMTVLGVQNDRFGGPN